MSVELFQKNNEEIKREKALRELTKSFFGIEKPLKGYINHIETLNDLIRELHVVFSSDYVNIELVNHLMMVFSLILFKKMSYYFLNAYNIHQ